MRAGHFYYGYKPLGGVHQMQHARIKMTLLAFMAATLLSSCAYIFPEQIKRSATSLMLLGQTQDAVNLLDSVIAAHPKDYEAYLLRAMAYAIDEKTDKALGDCNLILKEDPKNSDALVMRGLVRLKNDLSGAQFAQIDFEKAVSVAPKEPWPYLARAISRYKLGNEYGAKQDVQKVVALNPKDGATCGALCSELNLLGFREQYELYAKRLQGDSERELTKLTNFLKSPGTQPPPIAQLDAKLTLGILAARAINTIEAAQRQQSVNAYNQEMQQRSNQQEAEYRQQEQRRQELENELAARRGQYQRQLEQQRQQQLQEGMQSLNDELNERDSDERETDQ